MPFRSKRQQRAAFGGHIPGFSAAKAKEWAKETDFESIPERAPAEGGKPAMKTSSKARRLHRLVLRSVEEVDRALREPTMVPEYTQTASREHGRAKSSAFDALFDLCTKLAFALPKPGKVMASSKQVGSFHGTATPNFLKPPGRAASVQAINPRRSLKDAIHSFGA